MPTIETFLEPPALSKAVIINTALKSAGGRWRMKEGPGQIGNGLAKPRSKAIIAKPSNPLDNFTPLRGKG
jgi:hypothetical protein